MRSASMSQMRLISLFQTRAALRSALIVISQALDRVPAPSRRSAPIGIDVESIEWQADGAFRAPGVFTEREFAVFKAAGTEAQCRLFYQLWTRKEAYMKARGLRM